MNTYKIKILDVVYDDKNGNLCGIVPDDKTQLEHLPVLDQDREQVLYEFKLLSGHWLVDTSDMVLTVICH